MRGFCTLCNNFEIEDVKHMVPQCKYHKDTRRTMFYEIDAITDVSGRYILEGSNDILATIMGKECPGIDAKSMLTFWKVACKYVSGMYWDIVRPRRENG